MGSISEQLKNYFLKQYQTASPLNMILFWKFFLKYSQYQTNEKFSSSRFVGYGYMNYLK